MNFHFRIGFGIAKQLVRDGAKVMISSRKQDRVSSAVSELENEERGCEVKGVVCHVAKPQHRKNLIEEVSMFCKSTNVTVKLLIIVVSHAAVLSWSEICCGPVIRNEQILTVMTKSRTGCLRNSSCSLGANTRTCNRTLFIPGS